MDSATIYALAAIALWSTNAVVAKHVFAELSIAQIQLWQFLGASVVFFLMRLSRGQPEASAVSWWPTVLAGVVGITATMVFQYIAFSIGPIAQVNLVAYSWPLILALILTRDGTLPEPARIVVLATIGFVGVALVIDPFSSHLGPWHIGWGHLAALASALAMASYCYLVKQAPVRQVSAHLIGSVIGAAIAGCLFLTNGPTWQGSLELHVMAFYLGAGPIGLGYFFWACALRRDKRGRSAVLGFLTPVGSTLLLVLSGEHLSGLTLIGAALVIGSCAIVTWESNAQNQEPARS